ncbi:MAG: response regulator transcription factor [Xanthomonadales bacterium]|nr:response regulator transcription factor [Gammaproteobacteria bacterium]MBT8050379.1 response regulator transcription factor [Gammaproteobacteria bacterium]MBT8056970.1 response regulator transcription factor [Gammaproteobacteria bacterium]NNL04599.1 response regulator transcription factor [Xanthomonadales bacterium]
MRILLIEDDERLVESLGERLREAGYALDVSHDGVEGLYVGEEFPIDLAIIDLGLPGLNGLEVIRRLRQGGREFPILVLTARSDWQDKVEGLEAGADDYLTKPFQLEELMARINALLRRAGGHAKPKVEFGPITVDLTGQRVFRDSEEVDLTTFEFKVLQYLVMHPDEVVTKTDLSEHIYEEDADRDSNVIEVFIGRLRRKLDPDGTLKPIETLRGRGYRLALPVTP